MNIKVLDVDSHEWGSTLNSLSHDVYHLSPYVFLEAKRIAARPEAILLQEGDNVCFLPYLVRDCHEVFPHELRQGDVYDAVSPYGYPGLLYSPSAQANIAFTEQSIQVIKQVLASRKICSLFVRNHPILNDSFSSTLQENHLTFGGETVSIDLTLSNEQLWSHTRRGHQSTINKCKRLGYHVEFVNPQRYLDEFIAIYHETMSRVDAKSLYFFSQSYFKDLLGLVDHLHLGVVKLGDEIAAVSLFFEAKGIVQAHLGGTKTAFIQDSPFSLLLDQARYWAKARGNRFLHIGGGVGASADALYRFKSGFSKQRHKFWMLKLITNPEIYQHLVTLKEQALGSQLVTSFFPAYRAV